MNAAFARQLPPRRPPGRQRGISMFVVTIVLMLALVLVLGGLSVTNLNESLVGNQSDAQRAYGSAQALLDAAQRDIRLNGRFCDAAAMGGAGNNNTFPTPGTNTACTQRFPRNTTEYMVDMILSSPGLGNCGTTNDPDNYAGVCISSGPADPKFAADTINNGNADVNAQQQTNGANYTQFIAALDNAGASGTAYGGGATTGSNSALAAGGTYWVEVFTYNVISVAQGSGIGNIPVPDPAYPFVFRITAMARGLKGNTTASLLRTYYTPYLMK